MSNVKSEVERIINEVEKYIEASKYSLRVSWKSDCIELDLIGHEEKNCIYESVRVYNNGLWAGTGLLSWIRYHLDETCNLDELDAEAEEIPTDPEVEKAWEEYCIEEIEKELTLKKSKEEK